MLIPRRIAAVRRSRGFWLGVTLSLAQGLGRVIVHTAQVLRTLPPMRRSIVRTAISIAIAYVVAGASLAYGLVGVGQIGLVMNLIGTIAALLWPEHVSSIDRPGSPRSSRLLTLLLCLMVSIIVSAALWQRLRLITLR